MTPQQTVQQFRGGAVARVAAVAVASALAVAVAAVGIGTWLGARAGTETGGGRAAVEAAEQTSAVTMATDMADTLATDAIAQGAVHMARAPAGASRASRDASSVILVVESETSAQPLRAGLNEAELIQATAGGGALKLEVVWFDSAEAEARFQRAIAELNTLHGGLGLTPVAVIDLRARVVRLLPLDPAASSDAEMYQRWRQVQAALGLEPASHPDWN